MVNFSDKKNRSNLEIPKFVSIAIRIIAFISKRLSIKIAAYLFVTPIKFKTPNRELQMLETSKITFDDVEVINKKIRVLTYGYSDKKVLLVHGWSGRATQMYMIANKLLEQGFMVIAFDGPAHGKSSGKSTNLLEFIKSIEFLNSKYGPFVAAVGHSFGSISILNTQANHPIFKCLVTIGSGDYFTDININFIKNLGLSPHYSSKLYKYFSKKWNVNPDDYASSVVARKIIEPCFIVHDVNDGDVDVSCANTIRQNLQNGKLLITQHLGHTKILRESSVINKIVEFIKINS